MLTNRANVCRYRYHTENKLLKLLYQMREPCNNCVLVGKIAMKKTYYSLNARIKDLHDLGPQSAVLLQNKPTYVGIRPRQTISELIDSKRRLEAICGPDQWDFRINEVASE